jgi:hypothetical protein
MESSEQNSAFWMAKAAKAQESAGKMKNPMAKRGMEQIASNYEAFARRAAKGLTRPSLNTGVSRGTPPIS